MAHVDGIVKIARQLKELKSLKPRYFFGFSDSDIMIPLIGTGIKANSFGKFIEKIKNFSNEFCL